MNREKDVLLLFRATLRNGATRHFVTGAVSEDGITGCTLWLLL
jgi:hypothetical protein